MCIIFGRELLLIGFFSVAKKAISALKTFIFGKQVQNNQYLVMARPHGNEAT
jgi:hypothetical protein